MAEPLRAWESDGREHTSFGALETQQPMPHLSAAEPNGIARLFGSGEKDKTDKGFTAR